MQPKRTIAVYSITHVPSGRVYVGGTTHLRQRWLNHRNELNGGRHDNAPLQELWQRDGKDAFVFSVLETLPDATTLIEREQAWIDSLRAADPSYGLNRAPLAGTIRGTKFAPRTQAHMDRLSAALRGRTYAGTPKAAKHALRMRGGGNPNARLTEADAREIRALVADGQSYREVAARYGVTDKLVGQIVRRVAWKHVI